MSILILIIFLVGIALRFISVLTISVKNEVNLKNNNAKEYGANNSAIFGYLHLLFYYGSIVEAFIKKIQVDYLTLIGTIIYFLSFIVLYYIIQQLKGFWTTRIIIAENHQLNTSFLFKYIKHPNYYLNLIPELIGLSLICKSFYTCIFILPLYCITLILRIRIEEKAMREKFSNY